MGALWAGAALLASGGVLRASAELCSSASIPEVRYCGADEFCCGKACCPRSMLYFFKLSVAVVLIVLILVWLCNYMRRVSQRRHEPPPGLGPRMPSPYPMPGAQMQTQARTRQQTQTQAQTHTVYPAQMGAQQPRAPPAAVDDLPPPYHMVVNMAQPPAPPYDMPTTHLPSYDASCKAATGPP